MPGKTKPGIYDKYKMNDMHSKDMHSKDMHSKDYHTKDMHSKDMHSKDMHPKAMGMKVQGKILRVMGNRGTQNNDMPFKQLDIENAKAMDFNLSKPKEMFEKVMDHEKGLETLADKNKGLKYIGHEGLKDMHAKDMHSKDMHPKDYVFPFGLKKKMTKTVKPIERLGKQELGAQKLVANKKEVSFEPPIAMSKILTKIKKKRKNKDQKFPPKPTE
jgi:hypothetical protein